MVQKSESTWWARRWSTHLARAYFDIWINSVYRSEEHLCCCLLLLGSSVTHPVIDLRSHLPLNHRFCYPFQPYVNSSLRDNHIPTPLPSSAQTSINCLLARKWARQHLLFLLRFPTSPFIVCALQTCPRQTGWSNRILTILSVFKRLRSMNRLALLAHLKEGEGVVVRV